MGPATVPARSAHAVSAHPTRFERVTFAFGALLLALPAKAPRPRTVRMSAQHQIKISMRSLAINFDGRPLFGHSKTIRGILASIFITTASAPLIGMGLFVHGITSSRRHRVLKGTSECHSRFHPSRIFHAGLLDA
jgi:hypothetical protein